MKNKTPEDKVNLEELINKRFSIKALTETQASFLAGLFLGFLIGLVCAYLIWGLG